MMYDVAVIGSGPGGYVAAIRCAQLGLKTICVEKDPALGGTCLNVGCIPSKALLHSTELYDKLRHEAAANGVISGSLSFDIVKIMERKGQIVKGFNEGITWLFKKNKIDSLTGLAALTSPTSFTVGGKEITAKQIILATGSEPITLPFLPIDEKRIVTSTGALSLPSVPKRMLVIGAGIIGVELGSVYSRLGSQVVFVEFLDRICPTLDGSIARAFQEILQKQGLTFHLSTKVTSASGTTLTVEHEGASRTLEADVVLVSIGRRPYTKGLGLEKVGIKPTDRGFIPINGRFQTSVPTIYAIGDVVDGPMLAHKASEEGIAVAEIIAGQNPSIEYMAIPSVVYTDPEVAAVGLTEEEAKKMGLDIKVGTFPFKANSRAKCTGEDKGMVKIIADSATDRLLGMHILGAKASELIAEGCVAIQKKATVLDIAHTPHAHPTLSEAVKEAALDVHKRAIHK